MTDTPQDYGLVVVLAEELVKGTRLELSYDEAEEVARAAIAAMPDIAALRAENEALRAGLEQIDGQVSHTLMGDWSLAHKDIRKIARALLGSKP